MRNFILLKRDLLDDIVQRHEFSEDFYNYTENGGWCLRYDIKYVFFVYSEPKPGEQEVLIIRLYEDCQMAKIHAHYWAWRWTQIAPEGVIAWEVKDENGKVFTEINMDFVKQYKQMIKDVRDGRYEEEANQEEETKKEKTKEETNE